MPRYPGGDYYLPPGTIAEPDTTIESTKYNVFTADIETELNAQIDKDIAQDAAIATLTTTVGAADATYVNVAGDTMTGQLTLPTGPAAANAVRKDYVDSTFVDVAGDTMTGHLTLPTGPAAANAVRKDYVDAADTALAGSITTGDALKVAKAGDTITGTMHMSAVASPGAGMYYSTSATADRFFVGVQATSDNFRLYSQGGGDVLTIHGANANAAFAGAVSTGGTITANGDVYAGYSTTAGTFRFGTAGSYYITMDGSNISFTGVPGGGVYINNSLRSVTDMVASGNVSGSYISSSGNVNAGAAVSIHGSTAIVSDGVSGSNPYLVVLANFNPNWGQLSIQGLHYPGVWAGMLFNIGGTGSISFRNGGLAYKDGGSYSWDGISDARTKDVKGDYGSGLDAVAALRPVRFVYKGNDTFAPPSNTSDSQIDKPKDAKDPVAPYANSPNYQSATNQKEFIGLLAQEAELTMPELFFQTKAYIDGVAVDDFRNVNYSALTFALINAIKELKARIEALEAKVP